MLFNVFLSSRLPLVEVAVFVLHVLSVLVVIIPLWAAAPIGSIHETIFVFTNDAGWKDLGLATTISIIPMIGLLTGYDCSVHMSEETNDASINIPRVLLWAVVSNAVMLLLVGWSYIFCLGDLDSVLNTSTGQPMIQVFFNATGSHAGATIMTVVIILVLLAACIGQVATASRQMWSFARDQGFPASSWLSKVTLGSNIPLHAIVVSAICTSLLSLINLGSYTAFNVFNSLGTVSILFSYTITISCLIWRRLRGSPLPPRRWSLGKYGLTVNIFSVCLTTPMLFFYVWPLYYPVTAQNMNWSSTMFFGILFVAAIYYLFKGRKDYVGPVMHVKRED